MRQLLGHALAVKMSCRGCNAATKSDTLNREDFILTVKYRSALPLEQLLRQDTFGQGTVEGRRCDACDRVSDTPRFERILTSPAVLVVQLCRFTPNRQGVFVKDTKPIPFPERLNLTNCTKKRVTLMYTLQSVVQHSGSRSHGHYRTVSKAPSGSWEVLDDGKVFGADVEMAMRPQAGWTPYVLFYGREERRAEQVKDSA